MLSHETRPVSLRVPVERHALTGGSWGWAAATHSHASRSLVTALKTVSWRPAGFRTRQELFRELPDDLRDRMMAQNARPLLEEVGFFPPGMHHKQMREGCALVGSAASPTVLLTGQPLAAASPEVEGAGDGAAAAAAGAPCLFLLIEGRL